MELVVKIEIKEKDKLVGRYELEPVPVPSLENGINLQNDLIVVCEETIADYEKIWKTERV